MDGRFLVTGSRVSLALLRSNNPNNPADPDPDVDLEPLPHAFTFSCVTIQSTLLLSAMSNSHQDGSVRVFDLTVPADADTGFIGASFAFQAHNYATNGVSLSHLGNVS